ncbi:transcriptional regulator of acetoin/glycerol metabolism [Bradyrhizobium japonicum]
MPVDRRGTPADDATLQSWGLWTGTLWSEEHEGTNGIGTCLVDQPPLTIDRDQHFFTRNTILSCTAVPIYDHEAALAGVLDVSSCRTDALANLIAPSRALQPMPAADLLGGDIAHDHLAGGQRAVLQRTLLRAGGNVSAAAKALGVSCATLHRKLKRFELNH